jgi:hypothetical protein
VIISTAHHLLFKFGRVCRTFTSVKPKGELALEHVVGLTPRVDGVELAFSLEHYSPKKEKKAGKSGSKAPETYSLVCRAPSRREYTEWVQILQQVSFDRRFSKTLVDPSVRSTSSVCGC